MAVRHEKAARDDAELLEAEPSVKMERTRVGRDDRIELEDAVAERLSLRHAVPHELFADMPAAHAVLHRIARVADMAAASDVVRMQDVQTDDLARLCVLRKAGERLRPEEAVRILLRQLLPLRKGHAAAHDLVPYRSGRGCVVCPVLSDLDLHRCALLLLLPAYSIAYPARKWNCRANFTSALVKSTADVYNRCVQQSIKGGISLQLEQTLRTLTALPAVSGHEAQAAEAVAELFRPYCDTVEVDKNGNMLGFRSCGRKNAKTVLLDAHLDQIGFLVTEVLDGGFVRFAPVGGVDPRMLLGGEVTLLADEPLYGVVSCMPPHLLKAGEQDKAVPVSEMAIDTGLLDARSRIRVGTPIVFGQTPISLAGDQLCSKCLDDRAGIASILLAMKQLKKGKKLRCNIAVLISAQEEVTGLGAQTGAFAVQPEYAIAVDVTHGRTPDGPSDGVFDLGSGAAIGMGPNLHRGLTKALIRTAKANDIDYSLEIMEGDTGTNAWTMQIVGRGIACALLSIPQKYMHTPVEVVSLADVEAVADLMAAFLREFDVEVKA